MCFDWNLAADSAVLRWQQLAS